MELKETYAGKDEAVEHLKAMAKDHRIRTDADLWNRLEDKTYSPDELSDLFDDWYHLKLKTRVYPQYKDVQSVKRENVKLTPEGDAFSELDQMVGLASAKKIIKQAVNYYKAQKLFADKGMKAEQVSLHMVFTGNPGTAKTTVARLFARIMKDNHLLSTGRLVEVGRGDLVGKYVGWTADIVKKKFEEAKGGVLFIDEAYSLVDDRSGSYGDEAINAIVQEMENHRKDIVVIFAGYPDKMETFLKTNPGLRSRIAYHVTFEDYDTAALLEIAKLIARQKGLTLSEGALVKLKPVFEKARMKPDFGNGRFVRNVIEKAKMAQANRLLEMDYDSIGKEDVSTICAADIDVTETESETKKPIGFCA